MAFLFSQNANAGNLTLAWTASASSSVAGYVISYGSASKTYTANVDVKNVTRYQVTGLQDGAKYYFGVKAYNTGHTAESAYSNEASGTVPTSATGVVVNFTANQTSGTAPLVVNFTGTATASVTNWNWNFGDGTTASSTSATMSHTYNAAGTYSVSLTAVGAFGSATGAKTGFVTVTAPTTGTGTGTTPLSSNLVAAYNFDEVSGSLAADASGQGNHGTISGAIRGAGRFGNGLSFNGTNNYVTVNDSASLDLSAGYTLEAWVKPASIKSGNILTKEKSGGAVYGLYAYEDADLPVAAFNDGTAYRVTSGVNQLPINAWSHLVATYDRQNLRLYVNGTQVAVRPYTSLLQQSTGALKIGGNSVWGEYFNGVIDEVRIYNRALPTANIQADMNTAIATAKPPVRVLGYGTIYSTVDGNAQGIAEAVKAAPVKSGAVTSINFYLDASSTATEVVVGVYSDNAGHPGTLLSQAKIVSPKSASANTIKIPGTRIDSAKPYWLAILSTKEGTTKFRVQGASGTTPMETSASKTLTTLPNQWATGSVFTRGPLTINSYGY